MIKVCFFASTKEVVGAAEIHIEAAECADTHQLRAVLLERYPDLAELLPQCAIACNNVYTSAVHPISSGDEVAVLPPVSGG
mmetsp:Transcript_39503/g.86796  ORF Transcript_39503/g.86796 Transcript_39503/m.86796 type:complete len:81 (+) Transcript_39503:205-447(+)